MVYRNHRGQTIIELLMSLLVFISLLFAFNTLAKRQFELSKNKITQPIQKEF